jgi:hypothetical protein
MFRKSSYLCRSVPRSMATGAPLNDNCRPGTAGDPLLGYTRMDCRVAIHPDLNGSVGRANENVAATSLGYYSHAISRMRGHRYVSEGCPARPQIHLRLPPTCLCSPPTSENRDPLPWDFSCIIHEAQCETVEGDIVLERVGKVGHATRSAQGRRSRAGASRRLMSPTIADFNMASACWGSRS